MPSGTEALKKRMEASFSCGHICVSTGYKHRNGIDELHNLRNRQTFTVAEDVDLISCE